MEPSFWETGRPIGQPNAGFGAMPSTPSARAPVLPQTPTEFADVAAMTRAARVAKYGESAVAAMEAAGAKLGGAMPPGSLFGGATPVAPVAPVAPATPTSASTAPWYSNVTEPLSMPSVPTAVISRAGKVLTSVGRIGSVLAPAAEAGMAGAVAYNPNTSKADVAEQVAGGAGKLATAGIGASAGATLGALTGPAAPIAVPLGALIGGGLGYWGGASAISAAKGALGLDSRPPFERVMAGSAGGVAATAPAATAPAATAPAATAPAAATPALQQDGPIVQLKEGTPEFERAVEHEMVILRQGGISETGAVYPKVAEAANSRIWSEVLNGGGMIPSGTGAVINNSTGRATYLNTPPTQPAAPRLIPRGFGAARAALAGDIGAASMARMDEARNAGIDRAALSTTLKLPEIMKHGAEAAMSTAKLDAYIKETDPEKKLAILLGHMPPATTYDTPIANQPLVGADKIANVRNNRTGAMEARLIKPIAQATVEQIQAHAKANGQTMTPAQARGWAAQNGVQVTN